MREDIIIGLDIGTNFIRTVAAKRRADEPKPQIIGVGVAPSAGLRRGIVVDIEDTVKSISASVDEAEKTSGVRIEHAYVSIGGTHISSRSSRGVVAVSRADGEISEEDIGRVINAASAVSLPQNREIIHVLPREFNVDGEEGIKDPLGMSGVRLEVDALIVEGSSPAIKNITKCITEAGVEIDDLVLAPLAAARAVLTKRQKDLGVLVLNLGGGTVGMAVYEEGDIIDSYILPIGTSHITNDIAIGLRTAIDIAERVKLEYGSCLPEAIGKKEIINLAKIEEDEEGEISREEVARIIEARTSEMFDLTNKELKKIDRAGLLPAGIVLVGGGAKMPGLVELAKRELKLPVQIGYPLEVGGIVDKIDDPTFATAVGLVLWGSDIQEKSGRKGISLPNIPSISNTVNTLKRWFRSLLP